MAAALKIAAGLPALLFTLLGVAWWIAPDVAGAQLGMTLLDSVGLSSQIADLASFFLTLGSCALIGLATGDRLWIYPSILLLGFAICGRLIAWAFHDAALAVEMIAVEAVVISLLLLVARELGKQNKIFDGHLKTGGDNAA